MELEQLSIKTDDEKNIEKSLEMYDFIELCKDKHLTINDILNLSIGDELDVIIWDRNFEESWIWNKAELNKLYDAQEFFKDQRATLIYKGNMEWTIAFCWGESFDHPIHLNVEHLETYWTWMGIKNDGMIHIENEIIDKDSRIPDGWREKHIHWTNFPKSARAGWRGPIMLWNKLKELPKVYYVEV